MALKIGNNAVANAFVGSSQVRRAYKGGTLVYQGFGPASELEFIQQEATGGPAQLLKVYGKSVVWRQMVKNGTFADTSDWNAAGASSFSVSDGIASIVPNTKYQGIAQTITGVISGHKYLVKGMLYQAAAAGAYIKGSLKGENIVITIRTNTGAWKEASKIITAGTGSSSNIGVGSTLSSGFSEIKATGIIIIDLTDYFGEGNEPTTVAEAEQLLGEYDPTYDPGSLQSNKTAELRAYDGGTLRGSLQLNLSTLTGKLNGEGASVVVFPDGLRGVGTNRDKAYGSTGEVARAVVDLGTLNWAKNSDPRGVYFWARIPNAKAVAGYLVAPNAICANYLVVSGANRANKTICQYNPDTSDEWMIYDSVYDSADPATFKAAMSGVMLDYPLATPLTYTLDTPLPTDLTCEQGDILQRVSDNNCPFVGEMRYAL